MELPLSVQRCLQDLDLLQQQLLLQMLCRRRRRCRCQYHYRCCWLGDAQVALEVQ